MALSSHKHSPVVWACLIFAALCVLPFSFNSAENAFLPSRCQQQNLKSILPHRGSSPPPHENHSTVTAPQWLSFAIAGFSSVFAISQYTRHLGNRSSSGSTRGFATTVTRLCKTDPDADGAEDVTDPLEPSVKNIEIMQKFSNQYARRTGTYFCSDKAVAAVVVTGLAVHKETLGAPLCPCRHYEDKELEVKNGYWNCPCVPMRERHECHCMLFLEDSNPFSSDCQHLDLEEILRLKNT